MNRIGIIDNNTMRAIAALAGMLTLFGTSAAFAGGDADRGKEISVTCAACHGADGNSINPEWPSLAGQHESYLVRSMQSFKAGTRENVLMTPQANMLSDRDVADLAAYYAAQTAKKRTADPALVAQGERLYRGGDRENDIAACIACHGPNGRGNPGAEYPSLAGQHATYTTNQLLAYRASDRQSDAISGQVMRNISAEMSDDDIKAVSSYIQGLQ